MPSPPFPCYTPAQITSPASAPPTAACAHGEGLFLPAQHSFVAHAPGCKIPPYGNETPTLLLGDSLALLPGIPAASVDLVLTDPPYGTTDCPWDVCPPWQPLFAELWRVLKPNGALLVFAQNPLAAELISLNRRAFRYEWVWEKSRAQGFLNARRAPLRAHELILVFYRRVPTYNAVPIENQSGKPYKRIKNQYVPIYDYYDRGTCASIDGSRRPRDVVRFVNGTGCLHPTQKPLDLLRMLICQYTHPEQLGTWARDAISAALSPQS